jgi:hypothetical protein
VVKGRSGANLAAVSQEYGYGELPGVSEHVPPTSDMRTEHTYEEAPEIVSTAGPPLRPPPQPPVPGAPRARPLTMVDLPAPPPPPPPPTMPAATKSSSDRLSTVYATPAVAPPPPPPVAVSRRPPSTLAPPPLPSVPPQRAAEYATPALATGVLASGAAYTTPGLRKALDAPQHRTVSAYERDDDASAGYAVVDVGRVDYAAPSALTNYGAMLPPAPPAPRRVAAPPRPRASESSTDDLSDYGEAVVPQTRQPPPRAPPARPPPQPTSTRPPTIYLCVCVSIFLGLVFECAVSADRLWAGSFGCDCEQSVFFVSCLSAVTFLPIPDPAGSLARHAEATLAQAKWTAIKQRTMMRAVREAGHRTTIALTTTTTTSRPPRSPCPSPRQNLSRCVCVCVCACVCVCVCVCVCRGGFLVCVRLSAFASYVCAFD